MKTYAEVRAEAEARATADGVLRDRAAEVARLRAAHPTLADIPDDELVGLHTAFYKPGAETFEEFVRKRVRRGAP